MPSSSTHALIGGLLGATIISKGPQAILTGGLPLVILPLFLAPLAAVILGYLVNLILVFILRNARPRVNNTLRHFQIITMLLLAMSNSANDTQKLMGVITLGSVLHC